MSIPSIPSPTLWAMMFGNFVIGTGVMMVAGMFNELAQSLQASAEQVGDLVTAASLTICIGAPILTRMVARMDRRRLLTICMLWYALMHVLEAMAPGYAWLLPLRVLSMFAAALFTPQVAACIGSMAAPEHRGRAITFVFLGWSAASILGMPLSAVAGNQLGWRPTFGILSVLAATSAFFLWRTLPDGLRPPVVSGREWRILLSSPVVMLCVLVSALFSSGQFMMLAYFSPIFRDELGMSPRHIALLFAWFGLLSFIGNAVISRHIDKLGAVKVLHWGLLCVIFSLLFWQLSHLAPWALWPLIAPWALAIFVVNTSQQTRLISMMPAAATATVALNASAMYGGQALGSTIGGKLIAAQMMESMNWVAAALVIAALVLSLLMRRFKRALKAAPTA